MLGLMLIDSLRLVCTGGWSEVCVAVKYVMQEFRTII
jgi:hypothetical protein